MTPKIRMPAMTSVVVTGRRMKSSEMFMDLPRPPSAASAAVRISTLLPGRRRSWPSVTTRSPAASPFSMTVPSGSVRADGHRPRLDGVVGLDDVDVGALLPVLHRPLRGDDGAASSGREREHAR